MKCLHIDTDIIDFTNQLKAVVTASSSIFLNIQFHFFCFINLQYMPYCEIALDLSFVSSLRVAYGYYSLVLTTSYLFFFSQCSFFLKNYKKLSYGWRHAAPICLSMTSLMISYYFVTSTIWYLKKKNANCLHIR